MKVWHILMLLKSSFCCCAGSKWASGWARKQRGRLEYFCSGGGERGDGGSPGFLLAVGAEEGPRGDPQDWRVDSPARRGSSWRWAPRRGREAIRRTGEWTPRVRVVGEKSEDSNVQGQKEMRWMGHTWPQIWLICCYPVIQLCPTLRSCGRQHTKASLSFTISWSLHKLMFIKLGMPSNHLILCRPLLLLPSIFPSIRVFSNESGLCIRWPKYWSFTISPSKEYWRLISFRIDWLDLLAVQTILQSLLQHQSLKASILWC